MPAVPIPQDIKLNPICGWSGKDRQINCRSKGKRAPLNHGACAPVSTDTHKQCPAQRCGEPQLPLESVIEMQDLAVQTPEQTLRTQSRQQAKCDKPARIS
jgi:hypothetical protein